MFSIHIASTPIIIGLSHSLCMPINMVAPSLSSCPITGKGNLTITGTGFGHTDINPVVISPSICTNIIRLNDSTIICELIRKYLL